jgi:hypothetical protein
MKTKLGENIVSHFPTANELQDPIDLITSRLLLAENQPKSVTFTVGTQTNGIPHIGTYLVQAIAFKLAEKTRAQTGLSTNVSFGALDNVTYETKKDKQGRDFQKTYRDALGDAEIKKIIEANYSGFTKSLSDLTGVPYAVQTYTQQQATPEFRQEFLSVVPKLKELGIGVYPSSRKFNVSFPNPEDKFAEKNAAHTEFVHADSKSAVFKSLGLSGKFYNSEINADNGQETYLNLDPLGRNIVKELVLMRDKSTLNVNVKGGDWKFAGDYVDLGHGILGKNQTQVPLRIFTPQIVTTEGVKLSKSLIEAGYQKEIPEYLLNMKTFSEKYPDAPQRMLDAADFFTSGGKHLLRNYSPDLVAQLLRIDPISK